jgi:hypothetical protein
MRISKQIRAFVVALTCMGIAAPQVALANPNVSTNDAEIPVVTQIEDVSLQAGGVLRGAVVDPNGKPVANTPVAIGQNGKLLHEIQTDAEGRFEVAGMSEGTYQIASEAKAQNYRLWQASAPAQSKEGVIHVLPHGTARGQGGVVRVLSNPALLTVLTVAIVTITVISIDDGDGS